MNIEHETCGRCGRKLKTEASRREGFGPVCKKKWEAAKDAAEQTEAELIDQVLENAREIDGRAIR